MMCDRAITILDQEIHDRETTIARWQLSRRMGSASAVIIMEKLTNEMLLLEKIKAKLKEGE